MGLADHCLARWRFAKAKAHVPAQARLLDIGSEDGAFLRSLSGRIRSGVGLDPAYTKEAGSGGVRFLPGRFPQDIESLEGPFEAITMIAVLEHLEERELPACARACVLLLAPNGRVIVTMPSPRVDIILAWLQRLRLVEARTLHEHHGLHPRKVVQAFSAREELRLAVRKRFQLGLNNLLVFEKKQ